MKGHARLHLTRAERRRAYAAWAALRADRSPFAIPGFVESIQALAEQGYTLEDIGAMFGVSRERVRQWFKKLGLRAPSLHKGYGRSWDAVRHRFVTYLARDYRRLPTRSCRCGCGKLTRAIWAPGCALRGRKLGPRGASPRQVAAARRRWARMSAAERLVHGRKIAAGWARRRPAA